MKRITLKIQTKRLKLRTNRKKLSINSIFKDKEEILKILSKCKSYCSSHALLDLKSRTAHTLFESTLQSYIDFVQFEDIRIKDMQFDKNGILIITNSFYSSGDTFYILFSIDTITSYRKNKGGK